MDVNLMVVTNGGQYRACMLILMLYHCRYLILMFHHPERMMHVRREKEAQQKKREQELLMTRNQIKNKIESGSLASGHDSQEIFGAANDAQTGNTSTVIELEREGVKRLYASSRMEEKEAKAARTEYFSAPWSQFSRAEAPSDALAAKPEDVSDLS